MSLSLSICTMDMVDFVQESEFMVDPMSGVHIIYSDDIGNSERVEMNEERMELTEIELVENRKDTTESLGVLRNDGPLYRTKTMSDTYTTHTHHLESDGMEEDLIQVLNQMDTEMTDRKGNSTSAYL